ncbi:lymphocyte antigen 6E-like [Eublepharis macularius]|uniref:Lymphocyte antigen 6E-like n=1 Tax=Eublepharis macularius TaxID=481883 RepID=A0AA97JRN3_EUBMA|nr:lymphocyte antigen 6E-like [Eublepharis macularius]
MEIKDTEGKQLPDSSEKDACLPAWIAQGSPPRMKATFAALLAVLLCMERVSSLKCYVCDNVESNRNCLNKKTCNETDNYCVTSYLGGRVGENHKQSISKYCSPDCPEGRMNLGHMAFSVDCCNTHLCNVSGAMGVKSSFTVLAVGTLASLLYIFGAKL